jgi:DNA repair photolyase
MLPTLSLYPHRDPDNHYEQMFYASNMPRTEYYEIVAKSALNRVQHMGFDWSLNPYQGCFHSCVYCFARAHAKLADRDPGEGFSSRVGVKVNIAELLRRELSSPRWKRDKVAFGTATDPYQPVEGSRRLTRECLMALRDYRTPVGLITKGTMVLRDIDVLVELAQRASTTVCFSVPTVDQTVWSRTEPGTPPPLKRLRVMRQLVEAGIEAGVGMAPVLPGLSDSPAQLEATVAAAAEAGACFIWANIVYLKPGTREHFFSFLEREYPHLLPKYRDIFPGAYAPAAVKAPVTDAVARLRRRYEIADRRAFRAQPAEQPEAPVQLALLA